MDKQNEKKTSKRIYKKPLITSERLEMSVLASHGGGTCTCSGGSHGGFVQNAVSNWLS